MTAELQLDAISDITQSLLICGCMIFSAIAGAVFQYNCDQDNKPDALTMAIIIAFIAACIAFVILAGLLVCMAL